jgi:hypothetical protein
VSDLSLSQWDCLLKNLGVWQGSFTQLSPTGQVLADVPSLVSLSGLNNNQLNNDLNNNQTVRQTIRKFAATGELVYDRVLEYSSLNRGTLVFEDGAFSQGSIQYGVLAEFGAELGFLAADCRLRLVLQFDKTSHLAKLTLIREHRQGSPAPQRPPLTPEQLIGTWQGEAVTLYPDWRSPARYPTQLSVTLTGQHHNHLSQRLTLPDLEFSSVAQIEPQAEATILRFEQGRFPVQVLLLPDGASANTPLMIPRGQPFLLEAGWLIESDLRQRMIRSYDAKGEWVSLTLVTERKIADT